MDKRKGTAKQAMNPAGQAGERDVHVSRSMHEATLQGVTEGANIIVKVDPDNPPSLLVWGAAG